MTSLELYDLVTEVRRAAAEGRVEAHAGLLEGGARRTLNVAVAALGLLIAAPLLIVIAALVKLTSRGPVFYRQPRVGINRRGPLTPAGNHRRAIDMGGQPFTIYKFRTMSAASSRRSDAVWAAKNDARVTPIGRVLRKFRLDELPQLFNVLKGDMNVVGPRPEQPTIFHELRRQIPGYGHRQLVRPGITGWAQINHHYDTSIDDVRTKLHYDLEYISRQSFLEDLKIMLQTAPVLILKKGGW
jgi:lipopolysaccharide/colanic/teichoic acid biosynthesis glycosyltransferase